jgi:hypothetical protein
MTQGWRDKILSAIPAASGSKVALQGTMSRGRHARACEIPALCMRHCNTNARKLHCSKRDRRGR